MEHNTQALGERTDTHHSEEHWISVSDLMAGLMMVFLLIAIVYMVDVENERQKVTEITVTYTEMKHKLYEQLRAEFENDFAKWGAELGKDLTVRFKEPVLLFDTGSAELKAQFAIILDDFFPRYVAIITDDAYQSSITDVRVEGHTSSIWGVGTSVADAYFLNMELSQTRTRKTLAYLLSIPAVQPQLAWLRKHMTANGLSSARPIMSTDGAEDVLRSQRVEFRIVTNAEERIAKILAVQ